MISLARRYGKEVTGVCQICGSEGKTEIHHIISRAKIGRIKEGQHNYDQDLMNNQGNLAELCIPCHRQTDSHLYRRWYLTQMSDDEREGYAKGNFGFKGAFTDSSPSKRKTSRRKPRNQCVGVKRDGNQCGQKNRAIPKGGYCYTHKDQAPEGHPQYALPDYKSSPPPGLHDEDDLMGERFLDAEHIATIQDLHMFGGEPGKNELELFADWSEAWRRRWLYREKW